MNGFVENIKAKLNDKMFIIGLVGIALMIVGVFLPLYKISIFGISRSFNYIYNEGSISDGIFIIIFALVAFILYGTNKTKFSLIPAILSLVLLINFYRNINSTIGSSYGSLSIGYYVLFIGTIMVGIGAVLSKK